jgi:hypothetical protein
MTDTPPDWVLIEAAKRSDTWPQEIETLRGSYDSWFIFRALCDMIQKYEQPPVDRKLLCAREALRQHGWMADTYAEAASIRAIELWEEGFGK